MSHQFDYLIILFYRVKESNLPKTSCKGAVPADEPTRYKVSGSDRNRTCGLFRGDCFQDSVERQPHSLPKKLRNYLRKNRTWTHISNLTFGVLPITLSNFRFLMRVREGSWTPIIGSTIQGNNRYTTRTLLKAGFGPATSALWGQRSTVWTSST